MVNRQLPSVTIGIPFFNAEATLLDSVRSVFAQTHQDWELILLDDGSTDGSLEIARSIDDPRVRVYSDGQNKRLAARLNEMTRLAKHEYMARMDADDLMSPRRIERQLELLVSRSDIDLVATGVCSLSDDYRPVGIRPVAPGHAVTPRGLLSGQSGILHGSVLGRREWFQRNPYKESLAKSQDTNLWVRAYSRNDLRVAFVPDPMYYYREDGNVSTPKLLLAYRIGRQTIMYDARDGFSTWERGRAIALSCGKSMAVVALSGLGRLDLIRGRRNRVIPTGVVNDALIREIESIRSIDLPRRAGPAGVSG